MYIAAEMYLYIYSYLYLTLPSFQFLLPWKFLNMFRIDILPSTLSVCYRCSPPFYLSVPVVASIFLYPPFPYFAVSLSPLPFHRLHILTVAYIPTLLPWHTLQHCVYHALLSTQAHISFHNNNSAPCPCPPPSIFPAFSLSHTHTQTRARTWLGTRQEL